ncbi:MAG: AraC family transcriptional regulator [Flavobacteriaceae bacterium]
MKIKPFKIPKPLQDNLVVQVDIAEIFYDNLHQHEEIQISYIIKGQGKLIVANSIHSYTSGDIFVIAGETPHLFQSIAGKSDSHMISLFFTKKSFGEGFFEIPELKEINTFFDTIARGFQIGSEKKSIQQIMQTLCTADTFEKFLHFLRLIKIIIAAEKTELTGFIQTKKISNAEGRRLQQVFNYVMHNFEKNISLHQVSDLVHMTPPAFCRFFKQRTNKTFFQFLIELRIEHACQMLFDPNKISIVEISEKSGFHSISNFNRAFKKIKKTTPSRYTHHL